MIYVGIKPCGCTVAGYSSRMPRPALARAIGEMILDGYRVERRTGEVSLQACRCELTPAHNPLRYHGDDITTAGNSEGI